MSDDSFSDGLQDHTTDAFVLRCETFVPSKAKKVAEMLKLAAIVVQEQGWRGVA